MTRLEERIGGALCGWVEGVRRRPGAVVAAVALASAAAGAYAATHLGINADNKDLLAEDVPFRRTWETFAEHFPTLDDALLVVVDAETPELAREATDALVERLEGSDVFRDVHVPGAGPFFERNGLLYRSADELDALATELARVQPVLAELTREPTVANLARVIRVGLDRVREGEAGPDDWPDILRRVGRATVAVYEEQPVSVSWEEVLLRGSALDPRRRQVVVAQPILEFDRLLPAARPLARIHDEARALGLEPERGVRVRVTGNPALSHEEMLGLVWDVGYAGAASLVAICGVLYAALRSVRLVSASLLTLVCGLVWTAAFAAATVERLNLVSIAFAVLFVGLGIDFAVHLGLHYEAHRRRGEAHGAGLAGAVRQVGSSLAICTLTTAIGFYAFAPTDFRGVAELGLVSGTGMFVIFALTLTLYPALLELWVREKTDWPERSEPARLGALAAAERHPRATCGAALALGVGAVALLPGLRFDSNVVEMRDPSTESVRTFRDLLADADTSPWRIDLMASDVAAAESLAARVEALPAVERAVTLADYVPENQAEKSEILADLALLLDFPSPPPGHGDPLPVSAQVEALRELHAELDRPWLEAEHSELAASARVLRDELARFLSRVEEDADPAAALASLEEILLGRLDDQLARIRRALRAEPFGLEDLPGELVRRLRAPDGTARIQVFPREDLSSTPALTRFVDQVRSVSPEATGLAANIVEFSRATADSLRRAFALSLAAVAALLALLWRRAADVGLALAPLLLGAALTGALLVVTATPFNFANVIVLPLLLGMGVDSAIHLVHRGLRAPDPGEPGAALAGTVTGRAVFYSALTTITSFGSLALSSHRGLASLGALLVAGMVLTLACNLLVLPAAIRLLRRARARRAAPDRAA